jgi:hypothetical protein
MLSSLHILQLSSYVFKISSSYKFHVTLHILKEYNVRYQFCLKVNSLMTLLVRSDGTMCSAVLGVVLKYTHCSALSWAPVF